jgi:Histidine kinase-, DNA gyrase B-, and HSP90-like ATPase
MKELSLHILDIVQNSLQAEATEIKIFVVEDLIQNIYSIKIVDNGKGIPEEKLSSLLDPFFTTKNKKTGLGIPLLKQHAEMAGGNLRIESKVGIGTSIIATFQHDNLDRQPMGNIVETITGIIRYNSETKFIYHHQYDEKEFELNTDEIKSELGEIPINSREVINFIEEYMHENLNEIST